MGSFNRSYCTEGCRRAYRANAGGQAKEKNLTPAEVDRVLTAAVDLETAPPWIRHPQVPS